MPESPDVLPARRGLPRWLKVTVISVLVVANLLALGAIWVLRTGNNLLATADTNREVAEVLDTASGDDLTFLVVGSDSREGLDDLTNFGPSGGARGDVVLLVRLDSDGSVGQMLSIPRDLYVDIPGHGEDRINAAYAQGGPALLVETIRESIGVEVNHYIEIDFLGFQALIDEIGGISVAFPHAARDAKSGLDVGAGTERLDGQMALAYARSRSYQEYRDGEWVSVDANDIGRTQRQQEVVRAILSELKSPTSITEAGQLASALAEHMTIDSRLARSSAADLAWKFRGILSGSLEGATLPVRDASVDGKSVVVADEPEATAMIANFIGGNQLASRPVRVEVLNGNGLKGAAADMSRALEANGFQVESIGDAASSDYEMTTVIVPEGSGDGEMIVSALGFGVVRVGSVDNGYDAVVIVGADAP